MSETKAWRKEHYVGEDTEWELWQHDSSAPKGYDETCLGYFYTEKAIDKVLALEERVRAAEAERDNYREAMRNACVGCRRHLPLDGDALTGFGHDDGVMRYPCFLSAEAKWLIYGPEAGMEKAETRLADSESALSDVATKLGLDFGRVTPAQLSKACVGTLDALMVALGVAQESASDSESARQAAEGRAATLRTALEKLTWTAHQAFHNWKLHGVVDCPEQECVESRAACGFDASLARTRRPRRRG